MNELPINVILIDYSFNTCRHPSECGIPKNSNKNYLGSVSDDGGGGGGG